MRRLSPTIAVFGAVLFATAPVAAVEPPVATVAVHMRRPRLVLVFENRSANAPAVSLVSESFDGALARKGYDVVDDLEVSEFIEALKLPRLDPLPPGVALRLLLRFHADQVLVVTINFLLEGKPRTRGPRASAAVGLSSRLIAADDKVRWRGSLGFIDSEAIRSSGHDDRAGAVATTIGQGSESLLLSFPKGRRVLDEPARGSGPRFQLVNPQGSADSRAAKGAGKPKSPRPPAP